MAIVQLFTNSIAKFALTKCTFCKNFGNCGGVC